MSQRTPNTVLVRLLTCLLLLGTQPWFVGLHASDLQTAIIELGVVPAEAEDQNEGPDDDPEPGAAPLHGCSLRAALEQGSARAGYEHGFDRSGLSLLPLAGLQPSAP